MNQYLQNPTNRKNIYLIGFMGVGKTTVAKKLAQKLQMNFIDSDSEIKKLAGKTIEAIFQEDGEQQFRQLEREFVQSGHPDSNCVVACGGGLPIADGIIDLLKSKGIVFALFAQTNTIHERTDRRSTRPLLQVEDKKEKINHLLAAREEIYQKAHYLIYSEGRPVEVVAADIARIYLSNCRKNRA